MSIFVNISHEHLTSVSVEMRDCCRLRHNLIMKYLLLLFVHLDYDPRGCSKMWTVMDTDEPRVLDVC